MRETAAFDWRSFLLTWSGEWADSLPAGESLSEDDEAARQARWLGLPPGPEERIAALESRLGRRMPPSYREFLAVTDGWRHAGGFVSVLAGTASAHWLDDASGLADSFEEPRRVPGQVCRRLSACTPWTNRTLPSQKVDMAW